MEGTQTTNMPIMQQPVQGNSQSNMCQAALQEAMIQCSIEQQPPMMPDQSTTMPDQPPMMPEQPQPPMMPEQSTTMQPEQQSTTMQSDGQPQQMDTPMPEQVMEGFQNEMALPKPSPNMVNNLMNALLMMCLFYLLSHKETLAFVMKNLKGVRGANGQVLWTLVFGVCYLFLKRYL
jgi:hypothetical protein